MTNDKKLSALKNGTSSTDKLESDLLRTFLAIADTGSFTRGAERMFRSQSAISLQVKRLEQILGQPVFERHARGVLLTPVGEKLRPVAQRIVNTLDTTIGELRVDALKGMIRIGIPDEYGETLLPQVVANFSRRHPLVELVVHCGFSPGFINSLARKDIDVAVYSAESVVGNASLLRQEKTYWVSSIHHSPHQQDPLPIALFDRACWWRDRALETLEQSGRRYRIVYTSESVAGIMAAISAGIAVGLVSETSLTSDVKILSDIDGLPQGPTSSLVLAYGDGVNSDLVEAMSESITQAFK